MFPQSFNARVAATHGHLGGHAGIPAAVSTPRPRSSRRGRRRRSPTERRACDRGGDGACAGRCRHAGDQQAERGKELVGAIEAINARQAALPANHRQNKILLVLLALFVVGQILVLEYRWLIKPIVRMAEVLAERRSARPMSLRAYALRGATRSAPSRRRSRKHFALVREQQESAQCRAGQAVRPAARSRRSSGARACRSRAASPTSCSGSKATPGACRRRRRILPSISSKARCARRRLGAVDRTGVQPRRRGGVLDPGHRDDADVGGRGRRADLDGRRRGAQRGRGGQGRRQGA